MVKASRSVPWVWGSVRCNLGQESWSDGQQSWLEGPRGGDGPATCVVSFRTVARVLEPEVEMGRREGG